MAAETLEIEHEGEVFEYSIETHVTCEHCGYAWHTESKLNRPTCPDCNKKTERVVTEQYHFHIKMAWWFENPGTDLEKHTTALRQAARRLEALAANGWELTQADGEHVYFEREGREDSDRSFKVSRTLE